MARYAADKTLEHLGPPQRQPSSAIDTKKPKPPAFAKVEEHTAAHCQTADPECDVRAEKTIYEPGRWGCPGCCTRLFGYDGGGAGG